MSALIVSFNPNKDSVYPETYLAAGGQMLAIIFVVAWSLTWFANPGIIHKNPLKDRIGYNNLCVGFDSAPAVYAAQVLFIPCAYLVYRFAATNFQRTSMIKDQLTAAQFHVNRILDILMACSISAFSLVFVISPFVSHWWHSLAFIQYIVVRFFAVATNFGMYDHSSRPALSKAYLVVYGVVSFLFPALLITNYIAYDQAQAAGDTQFTAPFIPWWFTMAVDYLWFACLALSSVFMPRGEQLDFSGVSLSDDEGEEVEKR